MSPETQEAISFITKAINTIIALGVIPYGLLRRRRPEVHIPVMLTAFAVDLANVILIEVTGWLTRNQGAVGKAMETVAGEGEFLQKLHIIVSALCIVGYIVAIVTGTRLRRTGRARRVHLANACVFLIMRIASYATSFWM